MSIWQNSIRFLNLRYLFQDARVIFEDNVDNASIKYIGVTGSLETMKRKDFENYIEGLSIVGISKQIENGKQKIFVNGVECQEKFFRNRYTRRL